ncbi:hypothetical protein CVS40_3291 [Lucilia cuprina]|nr:hypothetical protein CVS40_3291 [Lucilia cuprina]
MSLVRKLKEVNIDNKLVLDLYTTFEGYCKTCVTNYIIISSKYNLYAGKNKNSENKLSTLEIFKFYLHFWSFVTNKLFVNENEDSRHFSVPFHYKLMLRRLTCLRKKLDTLH